jgi:L,D-transpeptidase ErfK/SrfK
MRASHGCIRLYPEDIATLFPQLPIGTKVTVVNQPLLYKVQDGQFYVQSFPPHEEHPEAKAAAKGQRFNKKVQDKMAQRAKLAAVTVDWALVEQVVNAAKGVAVPVSQPTVGLDQFLASALLVENRIPDGATWDGSDRPVPIRDEAAVVAPVAASGGR